MAINKVQFGSNTLMDITDTTTETEDVIEGKVFYAKNGVRSTGSLGDATQSTHGLMSVVDKIKLDNAVITENFNSVSIASFDDAAQMNAVDVTVDVDPIQDLYGYDNPWPAGGGVNKLPPMEVAEQYTDVTISVSGETYTLNGNPNAYGQAVASNSFALPAGTYYFKTFTVSGTGNAYPQIRSTDGLTTYATTATPTFTLTESTELKARFTWDANLHASNLVVRLMIATGTTEPTAWTPYSNICPISGWTGANVVVSPTTDAQDGTTYPISWQSEAGTVYGGTLDVTTGLLTVDRASKTFDGSETWEWYSNRSLGMSDVSGGVITDRVTQYNKCVTNCDLFKTESWTGMNRTGTVGMFYGQSKIYLKYDGFTSADDIKTFLAANPMTIVYLLATPQTYQLTPTQIALLEGVNNVWADTGNITITYKRQDALGINENINPAYIGAKTIQTAVNSPTANGTTTSFIDSITQNEQGVITPTKKSIPTATTEAAGLMSTIDKIKLDRISTMIGATSSEDGSSGLVPAPTTTDINKFLAGDGTYKDGGQPMVVLSYGKSVWNDFIEAYNNHVIVYCRASSNSNPATGAQGRMAFMAYVNNGNNPTEVEF